MQMWWTQCNAVRREGQRGRWKVVLCVGGICRKLLFNSFTIIFIWMLRLRGYPISPHICKFPSFWTDGAACLLYIAKALFVTFSSQEKVIVLCLEAYINLYMPSYTILLYSLQFSANPSACNLLKTAYLLYNLANHAIWGTKNGGSVCSHHLKIT